MVYLLIIACSAALSFIMLMFMSLKMTIAIAAVVGIILFLCQFFMKDFKTYWLAIFLLALPLAAPKILGSREEVLAVLNTLGVPTGAIPAPRVFLSDIFFLILLCIWFVESSLNQKRPEIPRIALYAAAFIGWSFLSLMNTVNISYSGFELMRLLKFFVLYLFMINNLKSVKRIRIVVLCLAIGVLLQGAITAVQYKYQFAVSLTGYSYMEETVGGREAPMTIDYSYGEGAIRGSGTVGPHNMEAMFFEMLLPLVLSVAIVSRRRPIGILYASAFILGLAGLYFTYSRGGMVGTLIGLSSVFIMCSWRRLIPKWAVIFILMLVPILATFSAPKVSEFMANRYAAGKSARMDLAKIGLRMVKEHPVVGFGINSSVLNLSDYDKEGITVGYPLPNNYLVVASEVGIVGLGILLLWYLQTCGVSLSLVGSENLLLSAVSIGILSAFIGIGAHMAIDHFNDEVNQTILWTFSGMVLAMRHIAGKAQALSPGLVPGRIEATGNA